MPSSPLVPTAVFVSGSGTNLQAVIDATKAGSLPLDLRLVVSDNPSALAIGRAARAGIPTHIDVWRKSDESRAAYGARLAQAVSRCGARLVLLLGWMHVLAKEFLDAEFDGVLNLHPAYLPDDPEADVATLPDGTTVTAFRGAHALRDAIDARVPMSGATLIAITPDVDRGAVLARRAFVLDPEEDEAAALKRLRPIEQAVVREGVLAWIASRAQAVSQ